MSSARLPLLVTKLHLPAARPEWVRRERLFQALEGIRSKKCAVIAAPAGYGKSWARVCRLGGDEMGCRSALNQAYAAIRERRAAAIASRLADFLQSYENDLQELEAALLLDAGDWRSVEALLHADHTPEMGKLVSAPSAAVLTGYLWLMSGRSQAALPLGQELGRLARQYGWLGYELRACLIQASAHNHLGNLPAAQTSLAQALNLAEPEGYIRPFLDGGEAIQHLLRIYQRQILPVASSSYIEQILQAFNTPRATPPASSASQAPASAALSEREIQIVRLLAAGLSNEKIAARLVLSTNTVKTHLKRIFEKLGVNNRIEAVNLARARGWIDNG